MASEIDTQVFPKEFRASQPGSLSLPTWANMEAPKVAEWFKIYFLSDPVEGLRRLRAGEPLDDLVPGRVRSPEPATREEQAVIPPPERLIQKRRMEDDGWVYFIRADKLGPIKIGITSTVRHRFVNLQVASPLRLYFLGAFEGDGKREEALHYEFGPFRYRGEWYWQHPTLLKRIAKLVNCEQPPDMERFRP